MIKKNFICKIIEEDIKKKNKKIKTRFPPEPNGYLHIGHAKSIYINFNIAKKYHGECNLRFDDTNPQKEKKIYIKKIIQDIKWLGYKLTNNNIKYASNYFTLYYKYAKQLIKKKLAYIDHLSLQKIKKYRGTFNLKGINSPFRNRSIKQNLFYFKQMKKGVYNEGDICLRLKINMKSNNLTLRDPIIYRIKKHQHYKTKKQWCIYPTYDFAHCIADAIEKITHSICTLEFQNNRPLYEWILKNINIDHIPQQYEFARLNITYTLTSKRKINILIKNNVVSGWDDPRLLTISGMRQRGFTPSVIYNFCKLIGVSKQESIIDINILEECLRKELNISSYRLMAVLNPLKVKIINLKKYIYKYVPNHPHDIKKGKRKIILTNEIYIDKKDFQENYKNNFHGLILNKKIKLRYLGVLKCLNIKKKYNKIIYITCKYYKFEKKYKTLNIIHWVSKKHSIKSKFIILNQLFLKKKPNETHDILTIINKKSLIIKKGYVEKFQKIRIFQFEREGYFKLNKNHQDLTFNRIISLKKNLNKTKQKHAKKKI